MPSRRALLTLISATATAGCMNRAPGVSNDGFRLGPLWVTNGSNNPQELSLVLEREGETIFEDVLELGTESGENIVKLDPTWSIEPAVYSLSYGLSEMERETYELTAEENETTDGGCMFVQIDIHPAGDVPGHFLTPAREHPWNPPCP